MKRSGLRRSVKSFMKSAERDDFVKYCDYLCMASEKSSANGIMGPADDFPNYFFCIQCKLPWSLVSRLSARDQLI